MISMKNSLFYVIGINLKVEALFGNSFHKDFLFLNFYIFTSVDHLKTNHKQVQRIVSL